MKVKLSIVIALILITMSCKNNDPDNTVKILFLHHSTGQTIWNGDRTTFVSNIVSKVSTRLSRKFYKKASIPKSFKKYNHRNQCNYKIEERIFPKTEPYGWNNYPFDYYNIWVKNDDLDYYIEEPTLKQLTKQYQVIIFKHCFPVSNILIDRDTADIDSDYKSIANYKLQYHALLDKLHEYPDTKFILWTGAAQVKAQISEDEALRAKEFFKWVIDEWDRDNDNVFIWDFYNIQTNDSLYFPDDWARSSEDPHPDNQFAQRASQLFFNRIIDVIENKGHSTNIRGEINPN